MALALAPHGSAELPASYSHSNRMRRAEYERLKQEPQIELLKVQSWVKESGQKIVILFEGRDAAGKGGTIKRCIPICPAPARSCSSTAPGTTAPEWSG
ncbi:hypothetical protein BI344_15165 [Chromobacterium sphagni]|uniref:Polyphosphate kinase-2-related domain-containing protein n=1 Tax=Chromobacterium sphagni TaxID=1903179 RepID=A0ABX3CEJ0_9NEIS|nr:hypothetical protein BI344_15165 [Chromobacterium sphagni]